MYSKYCRRKNISEHVILQSIFSQCDGIGPLQGRPWYGPAKRSKKKSRAFFLQWVLRSLAAQQRVTIRIDIIV